MKENFTNKQAKKYKNKLETIYFNSINAFIPQYFTIGNSAEDFYKEFKIELKNLFNQDYSEIEKKLFIEKVITLINKHDDIFNRSSISKEYFNVLKARIIKITKDCLYDEAYVYLIDSNQKESKDFEKMDNYIKNYDPNFYIFGAFKYAKEKNNKLKQNKNIKFINLVKIKLQEMTENFGIEIIVANNIKWYEVNEWVDNMNLIIHNLSNEMKIPNKSIVNKNLTIICSNEYSAVSGLFINHQNHKEFIHIALDNLATMSHTFVHEYTHFLDYKAGQVYGRDKDALKNLYLSEYLLFNDLQETDEISTNMIIDTKKLLHHSLGIKDNNREIIKNKIEDLKNKFYNNLLKEIGINYEILPVEMSYLENKNHLFLNNLLIDIYEVSYHQVEFSELFSGDKYKREILQLSINIMEFNHLMNLSNEQAVALVNALNNPVFINNFFKEVKDFFTTNGIVKLTFGNESFFAESTTDYIKKSLKTSNPSYWTNVVEIIARVVENMHTPPIKIIENKKNIFDKFKKIGATTIVEALHKHHDSVELLYPNKEMYDLVFEEKIKTAFKSMFHYIEHNEQKRIYKKIYNNYK